MPTYDYACDECNNTVEIVQPFRSAPKRKCPSCGKLKLRRVISGGVGVVFKGSGFYVTDSRSSKSSKSTRSSSIAKDKVQSSETKSNKDTTSSTESKATSAPDKKTSAAQRNHKK